MLCPTNLGFRTRSEHVLCYSDACRPNEQLKATRLVCQ
jgi:hypothetical protein